MLEGVEFFEGLKSRTQVWIKQRFEIAEFIGFETRNKYSLEDETGHPIGFAAEQGKGLLGILFRMFLGHWRPYEIHVFDSARKHVLVAYHPFRLLFQRLEIRTVEGQAIGALQQRFAIFTKKFDVQDSQGRVILEMRSPLWRIWTFPFRRSNGAEVAKIEKKWSGILSEGFTDKDKFLVSFTETLTLQECALVLASGLFVDLQYFEVKAD